MNVEGCEEAKADWETGWAWAKYDPDRTDPEELVQAINENTPFHASLPEKTWFDAALRFATARRHSPSMGQSSLP